MNVAHDVIATPAINPGPQMSDRDFKRDMMGHLPSLRAFAISLVGKVDSADDLVQETVLKAWANRTRFAAGTNMRAWLFTILRNEFYSVFRKRRREVEDADGLIAGSVAVHPEQHGHMDMIDTQAALALLPVDQREALLLVAASDLSYEEAAAVCGVAVGTIKSRVNRARVRLSTLLQIAGPAELGRSADTQDIPASRQL